MGRHTSDTGAASGVSRDQARDAQLRAKLSANPYAGAQRELAIAVRRTPRPSRGRSLRQRSSAVFAVLASAGIVVTYALGPFSTIVGPAEANVGHVFGADAQTLRTGGTLAVGVGDEGYRVEAKPPPPPAAIAAATGWAPPAVTPDPGSAQAYASQALAARGFAAAEFDCLVALWNRESGWRVNAYSGSGAYGIPQALPGSKMASAGADWETNAATQIEWGLGYVVGRYGSPCGAWAHSQETGWY